VADRHGRGDRRRDLPLLTAVERATLIEALTRALDDSAYALDRLDREHCAEGRREEQQWARRFRALQRKLKGAR
jgi:hypothetical protein